MFFPGSKVRTKDGKAASVVTTSGTRVHTTRGVFDYSELSVVPGAAPGSSHSFSAQPSLSLVSSADLPPPPRAPEAAPRAPETAPAAPVAPSPPPSAPEMAPAAPAAPAAEIPKAEPAAPVTPPSGDGAEKKAKSNKEGKKS